MGIVVFMLKQQEITSTEIFYGACLAADGGRASLFHILTSTIALEIPTLTSHQHLKTDVTLLSN